MIELYAYTAVAVFVLALVAFSVKILREYERGVVFLLGRFWKVKGPGLIIIVPLIQQMVRCGWTCASSSSTCPRRT